MEPCFSFPPLAGLADAAFLFLPALLQREYQGVLAAAERAERAEQALGAEREEHRHAREQLRALQSEVASLGGAAAQAGQAAARLAEECAAREAAEDRTAQLEEQLAAAQDRWGQLPYQAGFLQLLLVAWLFLVCVDRECTASSKCSGLNFWPGRQDVFLKLFWPFLPSTFRGAGRSRRQLPGCRPPSSWASVTRCGSRS